MAVGGLHAATERPSPANVTLRTSARGGDSEIGIVIPALDEAASLPALLADLARLDLRRYLLVVDGGSLDHTVRVARAGGAQVLRSRRGRARQMNAGAVFLATPWLLFLHADSRLGGDALAAIAGHVRANKDRAGYFGLAFDHPHRFYRMLEWGQRRRERRLGLIYGDQGLLIPRDLFFAAGAFPDEPLMEDVLLNRRLLRESRLYPLPATIRTSARRYEDEGRIRALVRNVRLISRLLAGADPVSLAAAYPSRRVPRRPPASRRADARLLVFARAPRPGAVKTRLARTLGDGRAAEIYRRMGRLVVDRVAPAPARLAVCHSPDDAGEEVREWLGSPPAEYWPQGSGDLGGRMSRMFDRAFEGSERVVVIGTDAPAVGAETIRRALEALDSADVVLGPASDGGYYLIGLRRPRPGLFTDINWGTGSVLEETIARAWSLRLDVTCLEVESDIDTAADLTPAVIGQLGREVRRSPPGVYPRVPCRPNS